MTKRFAFESIDSNKENYKEKLFFLNYFGYEQKAVFAYALALFIVPLFPLNQLITGTIVNALLIKSALDYKTKKIYLLSIIPSTAVFAGGVLFGNLSGHVLYMLPFIWVSNSLLMFVMRKGLIKNKKSYIYSAITSGVAKTFFLSICAVGLYYLNIVPFAFLTMFGALQLVTAEAGAALVAITRKFYR
jgi:hypothetical protein